MASEWTAIRLGDVTRFTSGGTPSKENLSYWVNSIDEDGSILADKLTKIPDFVHEGMLKRSIIHVNDVLYTIAGTIGRIAIAQEWMLPANTNQAVAIIRPKSEIPAWFLVLTMRHEVFRQQLHANIVHAVQANLSLGMLSKAQCVVPTDETLPGHTRIHCGP